MSMARVTYGAYVVLPVVSMVGVLSLAVGAERLWAGCGGGGEGAVDDRWCGPRRRKWWRCDRCRGGEGGVGDGGVPRVVYWLFMVELFLVCGKPRSGGGGVGGVNVP